MTNNKNKITALIRIFFAQYGKVLLIVPFVSVILTFVFYMVWNITWFINPTNNPILPNLYSIGFVLLIIFISMNSVITHKSINKNKYIPFTIIPIKNIYKYILILVLYLSSYVLALIFAYLSTFLVYIVMYAREMQFYYKAVNTLDVSFSLHIIDTPVYCFFICFIPSLYFIFTIWLRNLRNAVIFVGLTIVLYTYTITNVYVLSQTYYDDKYLFSVLSILLYISGYFIINKKQIK